MFEKLGIVLQKIFLKVIIFFYDFGFNIGKNEIHDNNEKYAVDSAIPFAPKSILRHMVLYRDHPTALNLKNRWNLGCSGNWVLPSESSLLRLESLPFSMIWKDDNRIRRYANLLTWGLNYTIEIWLELWSLDHLSFAPA